MYVHAPVLLRASNSAINCTADSFLALCMSYKVRAYFDKWGVPRLAGNFIWWGTPSSRTKFESSPELRKRTLLAKLV